MEQAVTEFKEENDLEADGVLNEETMYAVMDQLREKINTEDPQLQEATDILMEQAGLATEEAAAEDADSEEADTEEADSEE